MERIPQRRRRTAAFTVVELMVVAALASALLALTLPAVQRVRESARRTSCLNNLRNQAVGLHAYHAARGEFPAGQRVRPGSEYSWIAELLPFLEQGGLADRLDFDLPWNDAGGNWSAAQTALPLLRCPSSVESFPGDTDYGGLMGSALTSADWQGAFENGTLLKVVEPAGAVRLSDILDGTSQTIVAAESADRRSDEGGLWASGFNCFSHDNGALSAENGGEIHSLHRTGAHVAFADGATRYLRREIDAEVIGALCTRNLGELIDPQAY